MSSLKEEGKIGFLLFLYLWWHLVINGDKGPWEVEQNLLVTPATSPQPPFIAAVVGSVCGCF